MDTQCHGCAHTGGKARKSREIHVYGKVALLGDTEYIILVQHWYELGLRASPHLVGLPDSCLRKGFGFSPQRLFPGPGLPVI